MKAVLVCLGLVLSVGACKKSSGGPGGGGGGGTSWLVGASGLMSNVGTNGTASGYNLATTEDLNGIACRYSGEAWVVGSGGTLLYTNDAGTSWRPAAVPTSADLRAVGTQNWGPVFVAGDGVFLASTDTGASWTALGDGTVSFRSIAAAQDAATVLAISEDGALWSYENKQLVGRGSIAGARAIAVSPDGQTAIIVGDNMLAKSTDGGRNWAPLSAGENVRFDDIRIDDDGDALAVGAAGALAHISSDGRVAMQRVGTADLHTIHVSYTDDSDGLGFTAGDGGQVWMTTDEGWTWSPGANVGRAVYGLDQIGFGHR